MNVHEVFAEIDTFIFDIDGVWTDGSVLVTENGDLLRTMDTKDGYAAKRALNAGYKIFIITGGNSNGVKERLVKLGITEVYLSIRNKIDLFNQLEKEGKLHRSTSLYMGDDLPDCPVLKEVRLSCCPSDSVPELLAHCDYVSPFPGGKACVRDVIEKVMRSQDKWLPGNE